MRCSSFKGYKNTKTNQMKKQLNLKSKNNTDLILLSFKHSQLVKYKLGINFTNFKFLSSQSSVEHSNRRKKSGHSKTKFQIITIIHKIKVLFILANHIHWNQTWNVSTLNGKPSKAFWAWVVKVLSRTKTSSFKLSFWAIWAIILRIPLTFTVPAPQYTTRICNYSIEHSQTHYLKQ